MDLTRNLECGGKSDATPLSPPPLVLARSLYESAMNGYCKAAHVRRHADWTWNTLDEFKQAAWIAVAEYVRSRKQ